MAVALFVLIVNTSICKQSTGRAHEKKPLQLSLKKVPRLLPRSTLYLYFVRLTRGAPLHAIRLFALNVCKTGSLICCGAAHHNSVNWCYIILYIWCRLLDTGCGSNARHQRKYVGTIADTSGRCMCLSMSKNRVTAQPTIASLHLPSSKCGCAGRFPLVAKNTQHCRRMHNHKFRGEEIAAQGT